MPTVGSPRKFDFTFRTTAPAIEGLNKCDFVTETQDGEPYLDGGKNESSRSKEAIMSAITITKENFDREVLRSDRPVLLDFWASWCGPCRMLGPIIDQIAEERPDVKVGKVNVDEEQELAARFGIMSIPTTLVFDGGEVVRYSVGAVPKSSIMAML
jgi:thioredoxin 1